jgi:hypothetical protein
LVEPQVDPKQAWEVRMVATLRHPASHVVVAVMDGEDREAIASHLAMAAAIGIGRRPSERG